MMLLIYLENLHVGSRASPVDSLKGGQSGILFVHCVDVADANNGTLMMILI